ncbi:MAG: hypothetical protein E7478_06590 [Ruminococcaceae bacterium]|nr:hypothetical protein [Oscillospiraceae bacterium]
MNSINISSVRFKGDGMTRAKATDFNFKSGSELKLTNDERRRLIGMFRTKKAMNNALMMIVAGVMLSVATLVFIGGMSIMSRKDNKIDIPFLLPFLIPWIAMLVYGIYRAATCPKLEKSVIRAFEYPVDGIYTVIHGRYGNSYDPVDYLTAQDAARIKVTAHTRLDLGLMLVLGGNMVELLNAESNAVLRNGVNVGDKVRVAVLDGGKYIFLVVYL